MSKTAKILTFVLAAAVFAALFLVLMFRVRTEILFEYSASKPFEMKLFPSVPFGTSPDRKNPVLCRFDSVPDSKFRTAAFEIPLSGLRNFEFEIPSGTTFRLRGAGWRTGIFSSGSLSGMEFYRSARPNPFLKFEPAADGSSFRFETSHEAQGAFRLRLSNDLPRMLPFLIALPCALLCSLVLLLAADRSGRKFAVRLLSRRAALLSAVFLVMTGAPLLLSEFAVSDPARPRLNLLSPAEFPAEFSRWYRNSLPYRGNVFAIYHGLAGILGIQPGREVIEGQDGWFFGNLQRRGTGEMMYADYIGALQYSDSQLKLILENLEKYRSRLAEKNIRFVLMIAPDKQSVYGDFLPPSFRRPDDSVMTRARQVVRYVREHSDIPVVYPESELREVRGKCSVPLYFRTDTHWNDLGAYVAAKALLKVILPQAAAGMPPVESLQVRTNGELYGDMVRMLELPRAGYLEPVYMLKAGKELKLWDSAPDFYGWCEIECSRKPGAPVIFFTRDSFCAGIRPWISPYCSRMVFLWKSEYNRRMINEFKPDIFVYETVERYIDRLLEFHESDILPERGPAGE